MTFPAIAPTALITGALGQDGRLLAAHLLAAGYRVVGLVQPGRTLPADGTLSAMQLDHTSLADAEALRRLLDVVRPNQIYHLAALHHSSQEGGALDRAALCQAMLTQNFLATKNLAFAMLESQVHAHLVFAASSQMYRTGPEDRTIIESTPRDPATFYGHTKSWSVDLLSFLRTEHGLRASNAILFNHESPIRGKQFVSRKITSAAADAKLGRPVKLSLQNLAARTDWSSARDVARAMHLMASAEMAGDFVVGSGTLHSVQDIVEAAFGAVNLDWRQYVTAPKNQTAHGLAGSPGKLRDALGWRPTIGFEAMIREMVGQDLERNSDVPKQHL